MSLIVSPTSTVVVELAALRLDSGHSERTVHRRNLLRHWGNHESRGPNMLVLASQPPTMRRSPSLYSFHNPPCLCISRSSYPSIGVLTVSSASRWMSHGRGSINSAPRMMSCGHVSFPRTWRCREPGLGLPLHRGHSLCFLLWSDNV